MARRVTHGVTVDRESGERAHTCVRRVGDERTGERAAGLTIKPGRARTVTLECHPVGETSRRLKKIVTRRYVHRRGRSL